MNLHFKVAALPARNSSVKALPLGRAARMCEERTLSQPEARLSRGIMATLRSEGHFCYKVHGDEFTMAGLPDIIVCAQGKFIGLETKTPDKRSNVSEIQKLRHRQIQDAGGHVFVVCSPAEALRMVRRAIESP